MRNPVIFLIGLLLGISCNDIEDCQLDPYRDQLLVSMNHNLPIQFDSVFVEGFGRLEGVPDSVTSFFQLPVDFDANQVHYRFVTDTTVYSLSIGYQKEIKVFELNCDPAVRYFDLELLDFSFDSVILSSSELNTAFSVDVQVFFN